MKLCAIVTAAMLIATPWLASAQDTITQHPKDNRLFNRVVFYQQTPGTVAFLPNVRTGSEAQKAAVFDVLPASGRYEVPIAASYCFIVNHRFPEQDGVESYVGVAVVSTLKEGTDPGRPVSLYRNDFWRRAQDTSYATTNRRSKELPVTPKEFYRAHSRSVSLHDLDAALGYPWHGEYSASGDHSWRDRDRWDLSSSSGGVDLTGIVASGEPPEDLRFDGKLLRFVFTAKRSSAAPVVFCLEGDRRQGAILMLFSPDQPGFERRFDLTYR